LNRADPLPSGPTREFEAVVVALAVAIVGPFALVVGALLAALVRTRGRVWLWLLALVSSAVLLVLWRFIRIHLFAAATAVHAAHTHGDPRRIFLAVWPHLWPAWAAFVTLAPLIALTIVWRRPPSPLEQEPPHPKRSARREGKLARRAQAERERVDDGGGVFVGYGLGGDELLPTRRGRVSLPLQRLEHHLLVTGATGSGKTETVLRIAYSLAHASDWTIVYIDAKGDWQTKARFAALMQRAGREVALFPDENYDGWRGSADEISNRLLQLIDFADEGGGTYYRDLAVMAVRLACCAPCGPPRSSRDLRQRLSRDALTELYAGRPEAAEAASFRREDLDAIRARYTAFFATVGDQLDGSLALEQVDSAYFLLDGLRLKYETGYLARFLVEEFTQWAVARKPRDKHVLLVVDEFSAIAQASEALVQVVERTRGFGVSAVLCPQVAEGMGSELAAARIIGSTQTILLHAMTSPEQLVHAAGTKRVYSTSHQLEHDAFTGLASARLQHEYRVDPNDVRRLKPGQCFAIGSGRAMKLQIVPAPSGSSDRTLAEARPASLERPEFEHVKQRVDDRVPVIRRRFAPSPTTGHTNE
jgi:hypothetical protein